MRISVTFGPAELQDMVEAKAEQSCDPSVSSLLHPAEAAAKAPCPSLMLFAVSQPHIIYQEPDFPFCQAWVRGVCLHWHCGGSASATAAAVPQCPAQSVPAAVPALPCPAVGSAAVRPLQDRLSSLRVP